MKQTMKKTAIIFTFLMTTTLLFAQVNEKPDIGLMPLYKYMDENLLIVDATKGELVSFASVGEPIYLAVVYEVEKIFYLVTFNNLYKGDIETGDIIDKYQFNDLDFNDPDPLIKTKYTPLSVTLDGRLVYQKNGEMNAENNYILDQHLYVANINTKTSSFLYDITPENLYSGGPAIENGQITDEYIVVDSKNSLQKYINLDTKDIVKEMKRTIPDITALYPELKNNENNGNYDYFFPNLITYISTEKLTQTKDGGFEGNYTQIIYDTKAEKTLSKYEFGIEDISSIPIVAGYNTKNSTYYFYKRVPLKENPQPDASDYDFTKPGASDEMMKDLKKWQNAATNPDNYKVVIYEDGELKKVVTEIPKTMSVGIHNDIYAFVNRFYELELINIQTNETVWKIDTDF